LSEINIVDTDSLIVTIKKGVTIRGKVTIRERYFGIKKLKKKYYQFNWGTIKGYN